MNNENERKDINDESVRMTAGTAKSAVKAVGKAASGNYAGAALEVVKNTELMKTILIILVTVSILLTSVTVIFLYIIPMMVYETVQNAVSEANESYLEGFYSADGSGLRGEMSGFIKGIGKWIGSVAGSMKALVTESFSEAENKTDAFDFESMIENDSRIVSDSSTHIVSVWNKMEQIKEKYAERVKQIERTVTEKKMPIGDRIFVKTENYRGYSEDFLIQTAYRKFIEEYDQDWDVMTDAIWIPAYVENELSQNKSLNIAILYDVINDNNFDTARLTDFMKWLGYSSVKGDKLYFDVLGSKTDMDGWAGIYLPQYLVDETRIMAEKSGEEARDKKIKSMQNIFWRIYYGLNPEVRREDAVQKAYEKAYRKVIDEYFEKYGVSIIDMLIYVYTGELTQTEMIGEDDRDKNLLVIKNGEIISAEKYGFGHPAHTFSGWRYENYGKANQKDLLAEFIRKHGLEKYRISEEDNEPDGKSEGHIMLTQEERERTYRRTVSFSMHYSGSDRQWIYTVDGKTYTVNPVRDNVYARSAFNSVCSQFGYRLSYSSWGYDTAVYVYGEYGNTPVDLTFEYEDVYTVTEPYVTADFYKYYYRVTYTCPYYIALRPESEMLYMAGLLDGDYSEEHMRYIEMTGQTDDSNTGDEGDNAA